MGLPITISKVLTAADDDGISLSQTPLAGGNLTINGALASGGVATLDTQRRVLFTFAGNEAARTFVVYGTNQSGAAISETVAGTAPGTTPTNLNFKTVMRISIDAASAGAIKVGTNGVGSTDWQSINTFVTPVDVGLQCTVTGTVNYTIQLTNYDANNLPAGMEYPIAYDHALLTGQTATATGSIEDPASMFRLTLNSGTGSVRVAYAQGGVSGP